MPLPTVRELPPGARRSSSGGTSTCAIRRSRWPRVSAQPCGAGSGAPAATKSRIATSGIYKPRPDDAARGVVRLANWCGPKRVWEETAFPCPPNVAARVIGILMPRPGKRRAKRRLRGLVEIQKFQARWFLPRRGEAVSPGEDER
jgi:hypothetical protein